MHPHRIRRTAALCGALLALAAAPLPAQEVTLAADLVTRYIWRGFALLGTGAALQPSLSVALGETGLEAGIWSSFAIAGRSRPVDSVPRSQLDEVDLSLDYSRTAGPVELSAGAIHYNYIRLEDYPRGSTTTYELYLGAALPEVPFSPALTAYYDFRVGDGLYLLASVGRTLPLPIPLDVGASVGYMDQTWRGEPGVSDVNVGVGSTFSLGSLSLTPSVTYTHAPGVRNEPDGDIVWAGLGASWQPE